MITGATADRSEVIEDLISRLLDARAVGIVGRSTTRDRPVLSRGKVVKASAYCCVFPFDRVLLPAGDSSPVVEDPIELPATNSCRPPVRLIAAPATIRL